MNNRVNKVAGKVSFENEKEYLERNPWSLLEYIAEAHQKGYSVVGAILKQFLGKTRGKNDTIATSIPDAVFVSPRSIPGLNVDLKKFLEELREKKIRKTISPFAVTNREKE